MSNNRNVNWEIDDEDEDDDFIPQQGLDDSRLVRDFRKQLKAEQRKNKELQSAIDSFQSSQRERIIKDVLTSKGVNTKIAKFIPADIEVSEEAVNTWIEANADVFGLQVQAQEPEVNQQDIAALQRMNNVTTGALTPSLEETLASQMSNATTEEELMSILNSGQ